MACFGGCLGRGAFCPVQKKQLDPTAGSITWSRLSVFAASGGRRFLWSDGGFKRGIAPNGADPRRTKTKSAAQADGDSQYTGGS